MSPGGHILNFVFRFFLYFKCCCCTDTGVTQLSAGFFPTKRPFENQLRENKIRNNNSLLIVKLYLPLRSKVIKLWSTDYQGIP